MLGQGILEATVLTLIKGKSDLVLLGNKSSGKTYLATKVLNEALGQSNYIGIKCIFISDRGSLIYLFANQLQKLLMKFNSEFLAMSDYPNISSQGRYHFSLECWVSRLNRFIKNNEDSFNKIPRIYIFMDNIQNFCLNQALLRDFYLIFKHQIKFLKFSFFFCGISFQSPSFWFCEPMRNIPCFFMPRPNIRDIVNSAIKNSKFYILSQKHQHQEFTKLLTKIQDNLFHSFESLEHEYQRIWYMTQSFMIEVGEFVSLKPDNAKAWALNEDYEKKLLKKLKDYGSVTLERTLDEAVKEDIGSKEVQEGQITFYLQNYPNLLSTSLGLANGFSETEDKNRFLDMRKTKSAVAKNKMKQMASDPFKYDGKKFRHNKQRIVAIAQVLEEQSSGNFFRQKQLIHHSLDYYGCIQYMREEGYLNFYSTKGRLGGTITGRPKQTQVKDFMGKISLQYYQYTGKS